MEPPAAAKSAAKGIPSIGGGVIGTAAVALLMSVALIPYFAFKEIGRLIREDELSALILTRRAKAGALRLGSLRALRTREDRR